MSTKIIEFADTHIDPRWINEQLPCFDLIAKTGKENNISAFAFGGDWFNRVLYASDKDNYGLNIKTVKSLLSVAPVVCVTGTDGHDGAGCYEVLKELGFIVLSPAQPQVINGILFMGLPEINKIQFMKNKKMSSEEASTEIKKHIQSIIEKYFIPARKMHADKPAVFIGHGVYIDGIKDNDIIAKNTDIVIDNNWLKPCNFTRVVLGHYHKPKQSSVLPGGYVGYMGFDNTPWNNTGFQPGFNLTEIENPLMSKVTRIDYPVVRRDKIKINFDKLLSAPGLSFPKAIPENTSLKIKLEISKEKFKTLNIEDLKKDIMRDKNLKSLYSRHNAIRYYLFLLDTLSPWNIHSVVFLQVHRSIVIHSSERIGPNLYHHHM